MLSSVEQAFVGREEIRVPLKTPAWEAIMNHNGMQFCSLLPGKSLEMKLACVPV